MKILITGLTGFIGKNFYRHTKYRENIFAVSTKSSINKNFHSRNINYLDCNLENIDNHQISNGDLITLQLNEGVIYMGQIEDDDAIDKYKYV